MSRIQRLKDGLRSTVEKMRLDIEKTHLAGKIPADYSLGFTNGVIFCEHHLNNREGQPVFYDRTTSVGSLPKPVVLSTHSNIQGADEIFESLRDSVLLNARNFVSNFSNSAKAVPITDLKDSIAKLDAFIDDVSKAEQIEASNAKT